MNDLQRFREGVLADEPLQARLRDIPEIPEFLEACRAIAAEMDLILTDDALRSLLNDGRRRWLERHLL